MIKVQTTTEKIESKGGIILAGKISGKIGLRKIKSAFVKNAGTIISMLFGIMIEGKKDFDLPAAGRKHRREKEQHIF